MAKIPQPGTLKHRIGKVVHKAGQASINDVRAVITQPNTCAVRTAMLEMIRDEQIVEVAGDMYRCALYLGNHYDDSEAHEKAPVDVVPPRVTPEFRPISSKYIPTLEARRADAEPPRDFHPFSASASPDPVLRGAIK